MTTPGDFLSVMGLGSSVRQTQPGPLTAQTQMQLRGSRGMFADLMRRCQHLLVAFRSEVSARTVDARRILQTSDRAKRAMRALQP